MEQEKTKGSEFFKSVERIEGSLDILSDKLNVLSDRLRDFCVDRVENLKAETTEAIANESPAVDKLNSLNEMVGYQISKVHKLLDTLQI
jgi:hypothetical protein